MDSASAEMKEQQIFRRPEAPAARYDGWSARSVHIPMRDGVKLAAGILLPKDLAPDALAVRRSIPQRANRPASRDPGNP